MGRYVKVNAPPWIWAGTKYAGVTHTATGIPCQDSYQVRRLDSFLAVCVTDGAGSVEYAAEGAALVSRACVQWLIEQRANLLAKDDRSISEELCSYLHVNLDAAAASVSSPRNSFACTLIAMLFYPHGNWVGIHLGDGAIIATGAAMPVILSVPMKGRFAKQTYFITAPDAATHLRVVRDVAIGDREFTDFALFTDGLEEMLLDRRTRTLAPAAGKLLTWLQILQPRMTARILKAHQHLFREGSTDDGTIILVHLQSIAARLVAAHVRLGVRDRKFLVRKRLNISEVARKYFGGKSSAARRRLRKLTMSGLLTCDSHSEYRLTDFGKQVVSCNS